jgi:hypothetical protein
MAHQHNMAERNGAAETFFLLLQEQWKGFIRVDPFADPGDLARHAAEVLPLVFRNQDAWETWLNHLVIRRGIGPQVCCGWLTDQADHSLGDWLLAHLDADLKRIERVARSWGRMRTV